MMNREHFSDLEYSIFLNRQDILAAYFPSSSDEDDESRHIIIQPRHCLIGTAGASVAPCLSEAVTIWSNHHNRDVENIIANHNHASSVPAFETEALLAVSEGFDRVLTRISFCTLLLLYSITNVGVFGRCSTMSLPQLFSPLTAGQGTVQPQQENSFTH